MPLLFLKTKLESIYKEQKIVHDTCRKELKEQTLTLPVDKRYDFLEQNKTTSLLKNLRVCCTCLQLPLHFCTSIATLFLLQGHSDNTKKTVQ